MVLEETGPGAEDGSPYPGKDTQDPPPKAQSEENRDQWATFDACMGNI